MTAIKLQPRTEVYNLYWYFAAERQKIFFKRLRGEVQPWSNDPIFQTYKFCNTFRASDRVSQFLIKDVIYKGHYSERDMLFRILLFRLLNKIETWQLLERQFGVIAYSSFDFTHYSTFFRKLKEQGEILYGNAFILAAARVFGYEYKHDNHLALLQTIFTSQKAAQLLATKSLKDLVVSLKELPLIGNFMAYQLAIDLNYSTLFTFDENDFTLAGPGAVRGITKVFKNSDARSSDYIIKTMVERQENEFARLGIVFKNLFGRSLHAIDCQGLFCEVDKYSRVKFPQLKSNRSRIKTKYQSKKSLKKPFYPPKWGINESVELFFKKDNS